MKKVALAVSMAVFMTGCSTLSSKKEEEKVVTLKEKQESLIPLGSTFYPNWYTVDTKDPNSITVNATDRSRDLQFAVDKAMLNAKRDIALQIGAHVNVMMKELVNEAGADAGGDYVRDVERVSKIVANQVNLMGYKREKMELIREGEYYRAFVRVTFPLGEANRLMVGAIKADRIAKLKQDKKESFDELNKESEKRKPTDLTQHPVETFTVR